MKTILTALVALCAAASPALAQNKNKGPMPGQGIDWKGDWEAAVKEATARNVPIVFTIHKDNCPNCKAMEEGTLKNPKIIELSRSFVNVVAHQETTHGSTEMVLGKDKVKLCNDYGCISCDVHVKGWGAVGNFINGVFGTPTTIFCDPAGKELFRTAGDPGVGDMTKKMTEALGKVDGEKIPLATWTAAVQLQKDADAAFEKGDVKKAVDAWTKIGKIKGARFRVMSQDGLKKADETGDQALKDALALENVDEKKKALKKIVDDYQGLPVSGEAKKALDALK